METPEFFPYRSAAARDSYFDFYDAMAARVWPVASEIRKVPTSYGQTFMRVTGPAGGPPLVLLPGAVATSLMWAPNIKELSEVCRTYALDQIGDVGRTTCAKPVRQLNDQMAWLDETFNALGLKSGIHLMGCSYGGWLTAEYARHAPERMSAAILLAPGATVLRLNARFVIELALAAIAPRWRLRPMIAWMFADQIRKDPTWIDLLMEELRLGMRSVDRRLPFSPVWTDAEWAELTVPTLFLVGEHETIYDAAKAVERLKRVAPQVASEIIPGAGHDLTIAQAEMVDRKILEFVKQQAAALKALVTHAA